MGEDKSAGTSFGNVGVLLMAAIAYLAATHTQLLHDTRPVESTPAKDAAQSAEIEARLWQDPFQVVAETLKRRFPSIADMVITDIPPDTKIIEVMVPGDPYEESSEARRRRRYGVLMALGAAEYVPVTSGQLNVARLKGAQTTCTPRDTRGCVAWESFRLSPQPSKETKGQASVVTVVWLREDVAIEKIGQGDKPFDELSKVSANFSNAVTVLGPGSSDTLVRMFTECSSGPPAHPCSQQDTTHAALRLLDFGATRQLPETKGPVYGNWQSVLPDCAKDKSKSCFHRFGASDDYLVTALREELRRRGLRDREGSVVLLSEWDSAYGQELHSQMTNALPKGVVRDYNFFRGLDGKLSDDAEDTRSPSSATQRSQTRQDGQTQTDAKVQAEMDADGTAEGKSQIDYVRRLGEEIKSGAQDSDVDAIGIFGSDVYDKLMIAQELRPLFPHAVLFTTDLDARLLARDVRASTHNLVIASNFDLRLPELTQFKEFHAPPFRDNYETGAFISTLYAVQCDVVQEQISSVCKILTDTNSSGQAAMFELGVTGHIVSLAKPPPLEIALLFQRLFSAPFWIAFVGCLTTVSGLALISVAAAKADLRSFLTVGETSSGLRRVISRCWLAMVVLCFVALFSAPLLNVLLSEAGDGQPLAWADGTSLWPSIGLLLADSALAVWFIVLIILVLHANTVELATGFKLDEYKKVWALLRRRRLSREDFRLRRPSLPYLTDSKTLDIKAYWRKAYLFRCATISRLARGALVSVLTCVPIAYTAWATPAPPLTARGDLVRNVYFLSTCLCCGCMVLLASLVFDATMNSERFVRYIRSAPSHWPDETVAKYAAKLGFGEPCLADWIDMQFTRLRTRVILRLTYFPFIVIALLMVARGIADRTLLSNLVVIVAIGLSVLMLVASVVALRAEAEGQRRAMVKRLKEAASRAARETPPAAVASACAATHAQLELLIERAQSLRDGAFSAVLQQPILKAFVLPVLGYVAPWLAGALPG